MCMGPWAFKALAVAHDFDLFTLFAERGPLTVREVADHLGCARRPVEMLLTANASLGLLEVRDGTFGNAPVADAFLVKGKEQYFGGFIHQVNRRSYDGWGRLDEAVRSNQPVTWDPAAQKTAFESDPERVRMMQGAMHSLSRHSASVIAGVLDLSDSKRLLDVGGSICAYAIEFARKNPQLEIGVYDLPAVCELAEAKIDEADLRDRVSAIPGDFLTRELPEGYDTVFLSMILHDWQPQECRSLLRKAHRALAPGGRIIINELLVDDDKSGPYDAAMMSLNMLVNTVGRNYTAAEYAAWLVEAGFSEPERLPVDTVSSNGLLIATRLASGDSTRATA
ncbi:methyltransferase domain-containing protein [Streptomyces sp. NA04227]|nr:methyltransferase domain-containing protein [Streptomyces sp. NA04227]